MRDREPIFFACGLILIGCGLAILSFVGGCVRVVHLESPQALDRTKDDEQSARTALIVSICPEGAYSSSGVIIDSKRVLGAAHGVPCDSPILTITTIVGTTPGMVVARDSENDVVLLRPTVTFKIPKVKMRKAPRTAGSWLCQAAATPEFERYCGQLNRFTTRASGSMVYTGVAAQGNSGSGVYDNEGYLVGIVISKYIDGSNFVGAAEISKLKGLGL